MNRALALLDEGADPNTYDHAGREPLHPWMTWLDAKMPWMRGRPTLPPTDLSALTLSNLDLFTLKDPRVPWPPDNADTKADVWPVWYMRCRQPLTCALIERGADVNGGYKNRYHVYPPVLFCEEFYGLPSVVRLVLRHGGRLNTTWDGFTPLTFAALFGRSDVVETLLECGADVNQTDPDGYTALMRAASSQDLKSMAVLLRHHADVTIKNTKPLSYRTRLNCRTALGCAQTSRSYPPPTEKIERAVALLKKAGARE